MNRNLADQEVRDLPLSSPLAKKIPETLPSPFAFIPFCRDRDFVERGYILRQIDRRFSEAAARAALVGLGGVGYVHSKSSDM